MRHGKMDCTEKPNLKLPADPGFLWDRATATDVLLWDTINGNLKYLVKLWKFCENPLPLQGFFAKPEKHFWR